MLPRPPPNGGAGGTGGSKPADKALFVAVDGEQRQRLRLVELIRRISQQRCFVAPARHEEQLAGLPPKLALAGPGGLVNSSVALLLASGEEKPRVRIGLADGLRG